jgi:hypothetical protein
LIAELYYTDYGTLREYYVKSRVACPEPSDPNLFVCPNPDPSKVWLPKTNNTTLKIYRLRYRVFFEFR